MSHSSPASPPGSFWNELTDQERGALRLAARPRTFASGTQLAHQGDEADHLFIIESGWAKVSATSEDGREVLLAVRGPGDLVGEGGALGQPRRSATVIALGPVRALVVPSGRFMAFLDEHPRAWRTVGRMFVQRLEDADRRAQAQSADGTRRLALLLVYLADLSEQEGSRRADGSIEIRPSLSQEELGSWVDATRETVARALATWRANGVIRTGRRKIIIIDRHALHTYARGAGLTRHPTDQP